MLRRKVNQAEEAPADPEAVGDPVEPIEAVPAGEAEPDPVDQASEAESAEPGTAPEETPPTPPGPGPMAHHSPEPQTLAEQLTAQQQSQQQKEYMKERRANAKRQRAADKAKRKADKKAAKAARKAARKAPAEGGPLDLDPYAPIAPERPTDPPPGSPAAGIAEAGAGLEPDDAEPAEPVKRPAPQPPVDLPPIHPPGTAIRRTASLIGGIDLGGTKIAAAVIGPGHQVIAYRRRPTPDRGGPADVVRAMAATIQEAAEDAGTEAHRLLAVGVGSPGSVDTVTGDVSGAGNLPDWDGRFRLGQALSEEIGAPVKVGNDVQVGTRAEFELGAGAPYSSLLGVFWGTGVGGGIILDGRPWLGRGRAGEIGHTLVRRGGAKGLNGLNGTVEAYAGRKAMEEKARREVKKGRKTKLFKLMKKHEKTHLTSAVWQRALDDGDELAEDLLNRAVGALSAGIASAVNLLDVEAVVIGGGLGVRFADTLVPQIVDGMGRYLLDADNPPAVEVAALGDEGGVIGASLLVTDAFEANRAPTP